MLIIYHLKLFNLCTTLCPNYEMCLGNGRMTIKSFEFQDWLQLQLQVVPTISNDKYHRRDLQFQISLKFYLEIFVLKLFILNVGSTHISSLWASLTLLLKAINLFSFEMKQETKTSRICLWAESLWKNIINSYETQRLCFQPVLNRGCTENINPQPIRINSSIGIYKQHVI